MAKMPQNVIGLFKSVPAVQLCTASAAGKPNVNLIGMKDVVDEETLWLSDQFFVKTLANLQENPQVAIMVWDKEGGAFQICGAAEYLNEGEFFAAKKAWVDGIFASMGAPIVAKGGALVHVTAVYSSNPGTDTATSLC